MENNDLKKNNGIHATPDGKYPLEEKPSHDPIQHTSRGGGELTLPKDAKGEILPFRSKESKASLAQKQKKKDAEGTQVLPNRSWVTNFYYNYIKAVASADLNPKRATKPGQHPKETKANKIKQVSSSDLPVGDVFKPKVASSTFHSQLLLTANKQDSEATYGLKVDTLAIKTYKSSIAADKDKAIHASPGDENLTLIYPTHQAAKPTFSLSDIPIKQFEKFGIMQEELLQRGMLEKLLKGEKTIPVDNLFIKNSKGERVAYRASFFLEKKPDGTIAVKMNYLPKKPLVKGYDHIQVKGYDHIQGHKVSPEMKKQLEEKGSVPLSGEPVWGSVEWMLQVDKLQNKLLVIRNQEKNIPAEIKAVKLTQDQQLLLRQGREVTLCGLKTKEGILFTGSVKWDQQKNRLMFTSAFPESLPKTRNILKVGNTLAKAEVKSVNLSTQSESTGKEHLSQQPKGIRR